jgi:hypothetical protein
VTKPRFTPSLQWADPKTGMMTSEAQRILRALLDITYNRTGLETSDVVTGTAGSSGQLGKWNADGDLVGHATAAAILTFLTTPSSANLAGALTDETGTGAAVFASTPTLVTPVLGAATATSINFGGSTLNTYTEWTATAVAAFVTVGTSTWAYTSQTYSGTTIGNIVVAFMNFAATPTIGTGSGNFFVTGFPYTLPTTEVVVLSNLNSVWTWPAGRTQATGNLSVAGALTLVGIGSAVNANSFAAADMTSGSSHTFRANFCIVL